MSEGSRSSSLVRFAGLLLLVAGSALAGGLIATARRPPADPAGPASPTVSIAEGPVARIGGEAILGAELEAAVASALEQTRAKHEQQIAQEAKKMVEPQLERLIEERLLERAAREAGVSKDAYLGQTLGVTREDAVRWLEARGMDPAEAARREDYVARAIASIAGARRGEVLAELRERFPVEVLLEPERTKVEAGSAPRRGGGAGAPVEIVLFSDFECPFCARLVPTLAEIEARYGERVSVAFRNFPLAIHPRAQAAAEAALCAGEQGRFWQYHDALFANQKALASEALVAQAGVLGLDQPRFEACLADGRMAERVRADLGAGRAAGVSGTPALFVNGRRLDGARPFADIAALIDDELARRGA